MTTMQRSGWALAAVLLAGAAGMALAGDTPDARKGSRYGTTTKDVTAESRVLFTENGGLFVMEADAGDVRRLLPGSATCLSASWSPDGSALVFVGELELDRQLTGRGVYVARADGTDVRKVADLRSRFVTRPDWSPAPTADGSYLIVFDDAVDDSESAHDLFAVRPDGTALRNLTRTPDVCESYPSWSPDGRRIAYVAEQQRLLPPKRKPRGWSWSRDRGEPEPVLAEDVLVADVVTRDDRLVLADAENVTSVRRGKLAFDDGARESHDFSNLVWSHGGGALAVVVRAAPQRLQSDLWVIDLERPEAARNVTRTDRVSERSASWAPDDSHLLYARDAADREPAGICVVRADGRGAVRLLTATTARDPVDWEPAPHAGEVLAQRAETPTENDAIEALRR